MFDKFALREKASFGGSLKMSCVILEEARMVCATLIVFLNFSSPG